MLSELKITNIAVIESACFRPGSGFTCLTGETGAGKSVLMGSLGAVIGRKTSRDLIRTGEEKATVSALFESVSPRIAQMLADEGLPVEPDGTLLISREMTRDGKNKCRINGSPATVTMLRQIGMQLINIHGQHDAQIMSDPKNHLEILDRYADNAVLRERYVAVYRQLRSVMRQLKTMEADDESRQARIETLKRDVARIEDAGLTAGEYDALLAKRKIVTDAARLQKLLSGAYYAIIGDDDNDGAATLLMTAGEQLTSCAELPEISALRDRLTDAVYNVNDVAENLDRILTGLTFDEGEADRIEERLARLESLMKRYGGSEEAVLSYLGAASSELETLKAQNESLPLLRAERDRLLKETSDAALILSENRRKAGDRFASAVTQQLAFLDMPGAVFEVHMQRRSMCITGCDELEFYIGVNRGESVKPLAQTASGGEMSRIMLAVKSVLADLDDVDTLVFDEIDTGVSGHAAGRIAKKLSDVARARQVICITHLPAIAAFASQQYLIRKQTSQERTYTSVVPLDTDGRSREIARMIGGDERDQVHIASALRLMEEADEYRRQNK